MEFNYVRHRLKIIILYYLVKQNSPDNVCFQVNTYEDYIKYGLNGCGDFTGYLFILSF